MMYWIGMMAGEIGTAFAVRTRRSSLRSVGVFSNRYLLTAIAGVIVCAALFVYVPPLQKLLGGPSGATRLADDGPVRAETEP